MNNIRKRPVAFVSSTCYDLKQIREDIREFFEDNYGFEAMLSEFDTFPIDPSIGTFENCLSNVDNFADFFILIVGTRYGYITDNGKSITNLEFLHAKAKGIPIFVFLSKQVHNNLPLWRLNKQADYSSIVDNTKIFEFVSEIYDEEHQWIYTYENVRDIKMTMKNQLCSIFSKGLYYQNISKEPQYALLKNNLPANAVRVLVEKPYAWEYKFLAYILKDEFDKLQEHKWDYKYGIFDGNVLNREPLELMDDISEKINEILKYIDVLGTVINTTIQEAIGEPGVPSDLNMMIYTSKRLALIYVRLVRWSLYFKTLHIDNMFNHLLELIYELPHSALNSIDAFVDQFYNEITRLPNTDDHAERVLSFNCVLGIANTDEINDEFEKLRGMIS